MGNSPKFIVIHHSATDGGTFESIRRYHIQHNGFNDIAYHYLIEQDGSVHKGRKNFEEGAHTKEQGMNKKSIGICIVGNFDNTLPNDKQIKILVNLIKDLQHAYPIPAANIKFHRDYAINRWTGKPYKTCPGTQFTKTRLYKWMEEFK